MVPRSPLLRFPLGLSLRAPAPHLPLGFGLFFSAALAGFVSANLKHFCPHNSWTTKHKDLKNAQLQYSSTLPLGDHCILQVCNFLLTTSLWWKWGKGAWRLTLSVIPSFGGRRVLYTAAIGSFHPPLPHHPPPPHRPQGVWLVRGGLRQWPPWQLFACFLRFVCPSAFYTSCPITLPQIPCILTLTRLRTLRGSFKSFSV